MSEIPKKYLIGPPPEDVSTARQPIDTSGDIPQLPEDEDAKESL